MARVTAVITLSERRDRDSGESEHEVSSLDALYTRCRDAAPGKLVRVLLRGPEGTVRLDFANFTPRK